MPRWEEITPLTEKLPYRKAVSTTGFLVLSIAGGLVSVVAQYIQTPYLEWFSFDQAHAIGDLWLWQFLTYSLVPPDKLPVLSILIFALGLFIIAKFGRDLEHEVGAARMAAILLASVAYGALIHAVFQTVADSSIPAVGIFPAVVAVAVTAALRWPSKTVMFFFLFPMRFATATVVGLGIILFISVIEFQNGHTGVFAILGASAAAFFSERANRRMDHWAREKVTKQTRDKYVEEVEIRGRVDGLLEKISTQGMDSLTADEKRVLKRASKIFGEGAEKRLDE